MNDGQIKFLLELCQRPPGMMDAFDVDSLQKLARLAADDARRWRHVENDCYHAGGDWIVPGINRHPEDPSFAAAVDQDIERTAVIKRGGP